MNRTFAITVMALCALGATPALASPLVYKPINPSFGGDPLNGNWLFSQASAQTEGGNGSPGFVIDFPDFGNIPQPGIEDPTGLPQVPGQGGNN
jgi:curli production assembly/transport component CsgF